MLCRFCPISKSIINEQDIAADEEKKVKQINSRKRAVLKYGYIESDDWNKEKINERKRWR